MASWNCKLRHAHILKRFHHRQKRGNLKNNAAYPVQDARGKAIHLICGKVSGGVITAPFRLVVQGTREDRGKMVFMYRRQYFIRG
jgi:hypothetical protein